MKIFILTGLAIIALVSCRLKKESANITFSQTQPREVLRKYAETRVQALFQEGIVDTILIYELGCIGCLRDISRIYIIYSSSDGYVRATKLKPGSYYETFVVNDVFNFFKENLSVLQEEGEKLPSSNLSHYDFRKIQVLDSSSEILSFEYQFPNQYEQLVNKAPLRWIQMIDSEMLWLEVAELK